MKRTNQVILIIGTIIIYSCNNSQSTSNINQDIRATTQSQVEPVAQEDRPLTDYEHTADYLGDRNKQASKEEIAYLDDLIKTSKPYGRANIYHPFIREPTGTRAIEPVIVGNEPPKITPEMIYYKEEPSGYEWKPEEFIGKYGVYEINMDGKIIATYKLTRTGLVRRGM